MRLLQTGAQNTWIYPRPVIPKIGFKPQSLQQISLQIGISKKSLTIAKIVALIVLIRYRVSQC